MKVREYFFSIPTVEASKRQDVFSKMQIGHHQNIIQEYLGKVPTIFISSKGIKGSTYEIIEMGVRELIYMLYSKHKYLLQSNKIDDIQKSL